MIKGKVQQLQQQFQCLIMILLVQQGESYDNNCSICLNQTTQQLITQECKHSFCAECMYNCWIHNGRRQLKCPYCRQKIKTFKRGFQQATSESLWFIVRYNFQFGNQYFQIALSPYNTYCQMKIFFRQVYDLAKLLSNLALLVILTFLTLYVVSPIDLIPELYLGIFGLVDDILCIFFILWILLYLTIMR
ncbi:hypothetical protein pb186bvf_011188 [Paramecium bursaria]